MSNDILVSLTRAEIAQCKQAAALRWQLARASGVVNQRKDTDSSDDDIDYLGIRAELAAAKVLGCDYTPSALGIDEGIDMFIDDLSIDVKSTFHQSGKLLFKSLPAFKSDIAILVTATAWEEKMNVCGWVSQDRFKEKAEETDFGKGTCWTMGQEHLAPLKNLWLKITKEKLGKVA